ncbi:PEP-CTERM sorting domain-containing protein [Neptunicella sp.]|uniref:PEP-CTERM sorting domain-containing protein n=1 Tax=Neptunicella sp. TaxID=2125986 RepID=UPI003F691FFB
MNKAIFSAAALALSLSASAIASPVNVGGVVWDPDSFFDFTSNSNLVEDLLDAGADGVFGTADDVVDTLSGFGLVTGLNGTNQSTFCPSGCELTFEFGGFEIASVIPDGGGARLGFTGGWINFYVDSSTAYNALDKSTAVDGGTPWLSLQAHETFSGIHGIMTSIDATLSSYGAGTDAGLGGGLLDVVGGAAMGNFDTDTQTDGADWVFSTSFQPIPSGATPDGLELFGTADFRGSSIPEPSSIAILGLGLLGLAGASRRRQK